MDTLAPWKANFSPKGFRFGPMDLTAMFNGTPPTEKLSDTQPSPSGG